LKSIFFALIRPPFEAPQKCCPHPLQLPLFTYCSQWINDGGDDGLNDKEREGVTARE